MKLLFLPSTIWVSASDLMDDVVFSLIMNKLFPSIFLSSIWLIVFHLFMLVFFYRKHHHKWSAIYSQTRAIRLPSLARGDFNDSMGAHKNIGYLPIHISYEEFRAAIDSYYLNELDIRGAFYTWFNGRGTCSHVENRLNRAFVTEEFLSSGNNILALLSLAPF